MAEETMQNEEVAVTPETATADCAKCAEYLAGWKRAMADYQNREKDVAKEKQDIAAYTTVSLLNEFFPVLDNLQQAMTHVPEEQRALGWVQGIGFIHKQFTDVLGRYGLQSFSAVGTPFDPARHEAVGEAEGTPGIVVREVASGYQMGDRVVRPAKVIVGK
jgi:molecular chaperone GrpE